MSSPVSGTPRWAVVTAWLTLACVVPSGIWRTAVGFGAHLGWSQEHLDLEDIPGSGTLYVLALTAGSVVAAGLTLGLVYPWGERIAGRRVPAAAAVALALAGVVGTTYLVIGSIVNWSSVSGFADHPDSGWARLMLACYLPAGLWPVLLLAVTVAYARRRRQARLPHTGQAP